MACGIFLTTLAGVGLVGSASSFGDHAHVTNQFAGPKANRGTAKHTKEGKVNVLTLSDDFKVPDTPAPHWQVVDSKGNVYLLQRLVIKGDKLNKSIKLPSYIPDIASVQIWCAWAETLLGEAPFAAPVK
jgi:hypothetical protein